MRSTYFIRCCYQFIFSISSFFLLWCSDKDIYAKYVFTVGVMHLATYVLAFGKEYEMYRAVTKRHNEIEIEKNYLISLCLIIFITIPIVLFLIQLIRDDDSRVVLGYFYILPILIATSFFGKFTQLYFNIEIASIFSKEMTFSLLYIFIGLKFFFKSDVNNIYIILFTSISILAASILYILNNYKNKYIKIVASKKNININCYIYIYGFLAICNSRFMEYSSAYFAKDIFEEIILSSKYGSVMLVFWSIKSYLIQREIVDYRAVDKISLKQYLVKDVKYILLIILSGLLLVILINNFIFREYAQKYYVENLILIAVILYIGITIFYMSLANIHIGIFADKILILSGIAFLASNIIMLNIAGSDFILFLYASSISLMILYILIFKFTLNYIFRKI